MIIYHVAALEETTAQPLIMGWISYPFIVSLYTGINPQPCNTMPGIWPHMVLQCCPWISWASGVTNDNKLIFVLYTSHIRVTTIQHHAISIFSQVIVNIVLITRCISLDHCMSWWCTLFWWVYCSMWPGGFTQWGRDKMAVILQTTYSNVFSWMKML